MGTEQLLNGQFPETPVSKLARPQKGDNTMRFFLKISIPVEAGNAAAKKDRFKSIQLILEEQKPEAA
jgi:hypothetical protein